jgi:peptidoglycan/xylan/chitin deacetylase (PgdA/CDA1 family)
LQTKVPEEPKTAESVRVPIIVYHNVRPKYFGESEYQDNFDITPEMFETHLRYFKDQGYTPILFRDFANYLNFGSVDMPPRPIILTFDDGWENQYTYALPILKKYSNKATFFVFTGAIGKPHYLSWTELEEMVSSGNDVGSHSMTHPFLTQVADENKLRSEIADSKKIIEDRLGIIVDVFAYPFGQYNDEIVSLVKDAGYKAARGAARGIYHKREDLYKLRTIISSDDFNDLVRGLSK